MQFYANSELLVEKLDTTGLTLVKPVPDDLVEYLGAPEGETISILELKHEVRIANSCMGNRRKSSSFAIN